MQIEDDLDGDKLTFLDALNRSRGIKRGLMENVGLMNGDVIGLVMPNMLEYPLALLGATSAGIIVSPANPLSTKSIYQMK